LFPVSRRGGNIPVETMSERDDLLIAEFNARRSEDAFAALVRQHVNLVFATALRQVGDAGAAEEITQNVFVALAQSAGKLGSHPTIARRLTRSRTPLLQRGDGGLQIRDGPGIVTGMQLQVIQPRLQAVNSRLKV
jgi:hypothetical protein